MMQSDKIKKEYSVIILAAGKSARMGSSKALLKYNKKETFIEHIINEYIDFGCIQIVILSNVIDAKWYSENASKFSDNVKIVINQYPEWHRFYSLKIGAKSLSEVHSVFVQNVDNPFVNHNVLDKLMNESQQTDYISPQYNGKGGHPIFLSEKIIADVRATKEDQLHFREFLNQYPKKKVQVDDDKVLVNINTIDEYHKYFSF